MYQEHSLLKYSKQTAFVTFLTPVLCILCFVVSQLMQFLLLCTRKQRNSFSKPNILKSYSTWSNDKKKIQHSEEESRHSKGFSVSLKGNWRCLETLRWNLSKSVKVVGYFSAGSTRRISKVESTYFEWVPSSGRRRTAWTEKGDM